MTVILASKHDSNVSLTSILLPIRNMSTNMKIRRVLEVELNYLKSQRLEWKNYVQLQVFKANESNTGV